MKLENFLFIDIEKSNIKKEKVNKINIVDIIISVGAFFKRVELIRILKSVSMYNVLKYALRFIIISKHPVYSSEREYAYGEMKRSKKVFKAARWTYLKGTLLFMVRYERIRLLQKISRFGLGLCLVILSLAYLNKKEVVNINRLYNTVYTHSIPKQDKETQRFLDELAYIESRGDYKANRPGSQYVGKYQFGDICLKAVGFENYSKKELLNEPKLQEYIMLKWLKVLDKQLRCLDKYEGKWVGNYFITKSGLLASSHCVGAKTVIDFVKNGCKGQILDGNSFDASRHILFFAGRQIKFN